MPITPEVPVSAPFEEALARRIGTPAQFKRGAVPSEEVKARLSPSGYITPAEEVNLRIREIPDSPIDRSLMAITEDQSKLMDTAAALKQGLSGRLSTKGRLLSAQGAHMALMQEVYDDPEIKGIHSQLKKATGVEAAVLQRRIQDKINLIPRLREKVEQADLVIAESFERTDEDYEKQFDQYQQVIGQLRRSGVSTRRDAATAQFHKKIKSELGRLEQMDNIQEQMRKAREEASARVVSTPEEMKAYEDSARSVQAYAKKSQSLGYAEGFVRQLRGPGWQDVVQKDYEIDEDNRGLMAVRRAQTQLKDALDLQKARVITPEERRKKEARVKEIDSEIGQLRSRSPEGTVARLTAEEAVPRLQEESAKLQESLRLSVSDEAQRKQSVARGERLQNLAAARLRRLDKVFTGQRQAMDTEYEDSQFFLAGHARTEEMVQEKRRRASLDLTDLTGEYQSLLVGRDSRLSPDQVRSGQAYIKASQAYRRLDTFLSDFGELGSETEEYKQIDRFRQSLKTEEGRRVFAGVKTDQNLYNTEAWQQNVAKPMANRARRLMVEQLEEAVKTTRGQDLSEGVISARDQARQEISVLSSGIDIGSVDSARIESLGYFKKRVQPLLSQLSVAADVSTSKLPESMKRFEDYFNSAMREVEKVIEKSVEKIVRRPGYWVLALACILSFMLGHTISDRQREAYPESVIEESTRR